MKFNGTKMTASTFRVVGLLVTFNVLLFLVSSRFFTQDYLNRIKTVGVNSIFNQTVIPPRLEKFLNELTTQIHEVTRLLTLQSSAQVLLYLQKIFKTLETDSLGDNDHPETASKSSCCDVPDSWISLCLLDLAPSSENMSVMLSDLLTVLKPAGGGDSHVPLLVASVNSILRLQLQHLANLHSTRQKSLTFVASSIEELIIHVRTPYALLLDLSILPDKRLWKSATLAASLLQRPGLVQAVTFPLLKKKVKSINCYQLEINGYRLDVVQGTGPVYHHHTRCHFSVGPLLARTAFLRRLNLASDSLWPTASLLFLEIALQARVREQVIVQCTECGPVQVAKTTDRWLPIAKEKWLPFLRKWSLNDVYIDHKKMVEASCKDVDVHCTWQYNSDGLRMPDCCLRKQSLLVVQVLQECQYMGILCTLNAGTLLAAVKIGQAMPWDLDADVFFDVRAVNQVLTKMAQNFEAKEFSLEVSFQESYLVLKYGSSRYSGISVDFYGQDYSKGAPFFGQHKIDTEHSTTGYFYSHKAKLAFNPGHNVRQRYGPEVFKHSVHWISSGRGRDKYEGGVFPNCSLANNPACLDFAFPDGNLRLWNREVT